VAGHYRLGDTGVGADPGDRIDELRMPERYVRSECIWSDRDAGDGPLSRLDHDALGRRRGGWRAGARAPGRRVRKLVVSCSTVWRAHTRRPR